MQGHEPRNFRKLLEARKGKDTDFLLESPGGINPANTLTLAHGDPFRASDLPEL